MKSIKLAFVFFSLFILSGYKAIEATELTPEVIREMTESSSEFEYSSYEFSIADISSEQSPETIKLLSSDQSLDVIVTEKRKQFTIDYSEFDFINESEVLTIVAVNGYQFSDVEFDFSENKIMFSAPVDANLDNHIVLMNGHESDLKTIYFSLPAGGCISKGTHYPNTCNYDTDECGYHYASMAYEDSNFKLPYRNADRICSFDLKDKWLFTEKNTKLSDDLECAGFTVAQCVFYQR